MNNFNNINYFNMVKLTLKYSTTSLHILTDTVMNKLFNQKIAPFPRHITLYVTNKCNLNCQMCLNANYRNKKRTNNEINIKTIKKILPELIKYKPMVNVAGGEPLLNQDVFKIISLLSKNKIFTSMTTNGFILEKYAQQIINSGLEFLTISLDHYNEKKHDQGRGVRTTYKRLIKGLNKLILLRKNTPTNIKINTVITKNNFSELSKIYDFIEGLQINEWSVQHYSFTNSSARKNINKYLNRNNLGEYIVGSSIHTTSFLNTKQVKILQKELADIKRKSLFYKTKLSIKPEINNIFAYYSGKFPSKKSKCIWPFENVNIMERSKVMLCLGNEIGDLDDNSSIKQIWDSKKTYDFQNLISKEKILPLCFRCCGLKFIF